MITITELFDEQGIKYKTADQHKNIRDGWIGIDCPFCGNLDSKYHLGITLEGDRTSCWQCGWHSLTDVLVQITDQPFRICKQWAKNISPDLIEDKRKKEVTGTLKIPNGVGALLKPHRQYLKERGLDPDELQAKWHLRGIGAASSHAWRILIPIEFWGKTVSWTTRSLCDRGLRYLAAKPEQESMSPRQLLFGEQHCLHTIIVVEGPFDVFKIGYGAVATMGLGYSQEQLNRMASYPKRVICFDNEPHAKRRAAKLCQDLEAFPGETSYAELNAKDPGSAPTYEIMKLRKKYFGG